MQARDSVNWKCKCMTKLVQEVLSALSRRLKGKKIDKMVAGRRSMAYNRLWRLGRYDV